MQDYFFVSESSGALYDCRSPNWSMISALRENYKQHHNSIDSVANLKATLRAGKYTSLGGYPLYFITADGAALSFESVRENLESVMSEIQHNLNCGWRVMACDVNYEDESLYCDHSGEQIESAYGN
jgi:hypothetical protein